VADTSDADSDAFPLLIEYALGANPLLADRPPNYASSIIEQGLARRLALDLRRDPAKNDVTLLVQASSDLQLARNRPQRSRIGLHWSSDDLR